MLKIDFICLILTSYDITAIMWVRLVVITEKSTGSFELTNSIALSHEGITYELTNGIMPSH